MIGSCLCGEVQFKVTGNLPNFYQCHCSLCRKLSGSASDTATFLNAKQFTWLAGTEFIKSFSTNSGYRSDFCSRCGSTVPHLMTNQIQYWVPAGLLNGQVRNVVSAHLFVESKADWDVIGDDGRCYAEMPEMSELNNILQANSSESN